MGLMCCFLLSIYNTSERERESKKQREKQQRRRQLKALHDRVRHTEKRTDMATRATIWIVS